MHHTLITAREEIKMGLERFFAGPGEGLLHLPPWGEDLGRRLAEYAGRGKLLRGAMVPFSLRLFRPDDASHAAAAVQAGVAMELMQSFLLIHDDIMDQDDVRRGGPSVHAQYARTLDSQQYGISMGICAGDVAAFLAVEQMATLPVPEELRNRLTALFAREIVAVGLAQMQDVHHGYVERASREAVMQVYTWKTGRYTFSLPLMTGALLADAAPSQVDALAGFGEAIGRIFQIRDDQLGLFGTSEVIGKPAGSDIRENKKTIFRELLLERIGDGDPVRGLFGAATVSDGELKQVREALVKTGVLKDVDTVVEQERQFAEKAISSLTLGAAEEEALRSLLQYNLDRTV